MGAPLAFAGRFASGEYATYNERGNAVSALPNTRPMTLDDLELLPDTAGIQELLDGKLVRMLTAKRHIRVAATPSGTRIG